jgi:hypothetical protein
LKSAKFSTTYLVVDCQRFNRLCGFLFSRARLVENRAEMRAQILRKMAIWRFVGWQRRFYAAA